MRLLRELRRALDAVAGEGQSAQAAALEATLTEYGATMADVARALRTVRGRRDTELSGLAGRLQALADARDEAQETADAVDAFLRRASEGGRP